MSNLVDDYEDIVVNGITGFSTLFTSTAAVAFFSADPTDTGSVVNELSGDNYARVSLSSKFSASSGGISANTTAIDTPTASADWDEATYVGIMESAVATTDDMMMVIELNTPVTVLNGTIFTFEIGTLIVIGE